MKPGRERRKAWIYSVINPVLDGLRIEAPFLEKGNWTFRLDSRDLEFIRPAQAFMNYQSQPNWEDFTASNLGAKEKIDNRDARRDCLRKACCAAFDNLVAIPDFQKKTSESFRAFETEAPGETGRRVYSGAEPHEAIAELVVNNLAELPHYYVLRPFWSKFRDELMPFRTGAAFEAADKAGLELKKSNDDLALELGKVRSDLAADYDIPWAPYYDEASALPGR